MGVLRNTRGAPEHVESRPAAIVANAEAQPVSVVLDRVARTSPKKATASDVVTLLDRIFAVMQTPELTDGSRR